MYKLIVKYSAQNNNNNNNNNSIIDRDDRGRGGIILTQLRESNGGEIVPGSDGITIADKNALNVINLVILYGNDSK